MKLVILFTQRLSFGGRAVKTGGKAPKSYHLPEHLGLLNAGNFYLAIPHSPRSFATHIHSFPTKTLPQT